MRVAVTGANGFIGALLCARLVAAGHRVAAIHRTAANAVRLDVFAPEVERMRIDSFDAAPLHACLGTFLPDVLFHLAAAGIRDGRDVSPETVTTNVLGTLDVCRAAQEHAVRRVVCLGSGFEYASQGERVQESAPLEPFSMYGATKVAAWTLLKSLADSGTTEFVWARLFAAYGPGENIGRFLPLVTTRLLDRQDVQITSGTQIRDYLHVDDVVSALTLLMTAPGLAGRAVNVCSGEPISIAEMAELVCRAAAAPQGLLDLGAVPRRSEEPEHLVGDCSLLGSLGWSRERSIVAGIEATVEWYRQNRTLWHRLS